MQANKIIGWVGAIYFENYLQQQISDAELGNEHSHIETALFRLDQLTSGQISAIVQEILSKPALLQHISLKIPKALIGNEELPNDVLINDNAASVRNQSIDKQVLVTASSKNDIGDTLAHITIVSAKELKANGHAWVQACSKLGNLALTSDDEKAFAKALEAMIESIELSLVQIAEFCISIIEASNLHGYAIRQAIGWSLPSIGLPRDTNFFTNAEAFSKVTRTWKIAFDKLATHRYPLLKYQKPNGQPLDAAEMETRLNDNLDEFDSDHIAILKGFINGSVDDIEAIRSLAELEWEQHKVYLIFDRPKEKQRGLAESTLQFFSDICDPDDVLSEEWRNHLIELKTREKSGEWVDEDKFFFDLHRYFLEQDSKLLARWEKVIFGQAIECQDFLEGLVFATYQLLAGQEEFNGDRYLKISVNKGKKAWLDQFNHDVVTFFCVMYRGLYKTMGSKIIWEISNQRTPLADILFDYENFISQQKARLGNKFKPIKSLSRAALQIKFEVSLVERRSNNLDNVLKKIQLLWSYSPTSIGLSLADDLGRLLEKGGMACTNVSRKIVSKKGGVQSVALNNVSSLEATFSNDPGSLIPSKSKLESLRYQIKKSLENLYKDNLINEVAYQQIKQTWEKFEKIYPLAVQDFKLNGLNHSTIFNQADAYAELLDTLSTHACNDVCRNNLVSKVISIGTVVVSGEQSTLIIPPWHPERLKALAVKTQRTCALITHLLTAESLKFGDRNIFFKDFFDELKHPFYPEVGILQKKGVADLVSVTSTVNGYSLLEAPTYSKTSVLSDTSPQVAAKQINELIDRYVSLQPHKLRNLNILLYNSDAADLPLEVVKELSSLYDNEQSEMQCNVVVRHTEPKHLASIYAELVNKAADNEDLPLVSEISDNFISKLRIGVSKSANGNGNSLLGFKPFDIAFLYDVVARTATVEWIAVPWSEDRLSLEHAPSRWSYRLVAKDGDLKSTSFLTCPWQTSTGWSYLAAVAALAKKDAITKEDRLLPARQISLQHPHLAEIIDDAHQQAEWVATYDELLDKKQLQHRDITVVRYRRNTTNGRNMIVSSTADLKLLNGLTQKRLKDLALPLDQLQLNELTKRIKKDALSISGQIVLRAARRGISAGEMLGLVLSRYLIADEFKILNNGNDAFSVFFLLDDYASWLSQKESRIADLLALSVEDSSDGIRLHIAIIESKYVSYESVADAKRSSKAQLMSTLTSFKDALFGDPSRLDRDVWLSRISDLLVDADVSIGQTALLEQARIAIREGAVSISLRGYSHIFVHSSDVVNTNSVSEQLEVDSSQHFQAWQEVFDRKELRSLVEIYAEQQYSSSIRAILGSAEPWENVIFNRPAPRINWALVVEESDHTQQNSLLENTLDTAQNSEQSDHIQLPFNSTDDIKGNYLELDKVITVDENTIDLVQSKDQADRIMLNLGELIKLNHSAQTQDDIRNEWADKITKDLRRALNSWGFQVNVLGTRITPNGCLIRLAGSDRLRMEDIEAKRTQLLTTHAINIVTVQPKPGEIVVTVASEVRQAVSIWNLWARRQLNRNKAGINVSFVIGVQEVNGELLYLNLGGDFSGLPGHEPHSLVAGATGSGKSVLLQVLLLDITATNSTDLAQIILIDPKMGVDYTALEDLPHMREPIITTKERATEVLANLVDEMETRYRLFAQVKAKDLATYNSKVALSDRLPMIFLIHDEFADWMFDDNYKGAVGSAVQRLGVKARAAGIHLIFAAQRPDKDVMPMQLRENLGNRLILKVASEATSKIALDRSGAERLLGKGHLAAKLGGDLIFAQVPFVSDDEMTQIVNTIIESNLSNYMGSTVQT
ncbi:FtsK/SpoIIIE domain-containing protein [Acinetobacter sp. 3657]|uniref:FtsK/SpoIIIE domain-containing protein n=1 Tax=Acinetobacter sp. 3657 TaxID=2817764 RepID=UPI0028548A1E|nr:S-DNA-T family DNA segregation ATPase FtsK/SpoIIIE [Prolinoborus sp. 3657]